MLGYSKENWKSVLDTLKYVEQKNYKGGYDIFDDGGIQKWEYSNNKEKEQLYYFFSGIAYQRMRGERKKQKYETR